MVTHSLSPVQAARAASAAPRSKAMLLPDDTSGKTC